MSDIKFLTINSEKNILQQTYNDIEFTSTNDVAITTDKDYVAQAVGKVLKTVKTSDVPYPNYGSELNNIRRNIVGNSVLESLVANDIVSAISYIRSLEESPNKTENIAGITSINLETVTLDSLTKAVKVYMNVVTQANETVTITK